MITGGGGMLMNQGEVLVSRYESSFWESPILQHSSLPFFCNTYYIIFFELETVATLQALLENDIE